MALHAWIRRAASKVTVAYDGSLLEEGVFVYIKSVKIKDIPSTCLLGSKNTVMEKSGLIKEGETITYGPAGAAFDENWTARITKGHPYYPYDEKTNSSSSEPIRKSHKRFFSTKTCRERDKTKRRTKT